MDTVITSRRPHTDWTTLGGLLGLHRETVKRRARKLQIPTAQAPSRVRWTAAQDDQIRAMRAQGHTWVDIGSAIGVSPFMVRRRAMQLELDSLRVDAILWTPEMDEAIRAARHRGTSWVVVAEQIGVDVRVAQRRGVALELDMRDPRGLDVRMTDAERRHIVALRDEGLAMPRAAERLGLTLASLQRRVAHMGIRWGTAGPLPPRHVEAIRRGRAAQVAEQARMQALAVSRDRWAAD